MKWKIEYYNAKLERQVLSLPPGLLARYLRLTDLMIEFGANLGMPHTRYLSDGLIELRVKSKEGIARVLYCTLVKNKIMVLHLLIKKSNKIPRKELETAKRRMKEVTKNDT